MNPGVRFGRSFAGDAHLMERREWLVTNGLGGFAQGTVAGVATRRYHGLLFAATKPPVGRRLLVFALDAAFSCEGTTYELFSNRWADGTTGPNAALYLATFALDGSVPTWTFACGAARLTRRIWMEPGANTTYVAYALERASPPGSLIARALANDRDLHSLTGAEDRQLNVRPIAGGVTVRREPDGAPFFLRADRGRATAAHEWYRDYLYVEERARGLDDREDHLHAVTFETQLQPGETVTFELGLGEPVPGSIGEAAARRVRYDRACSDRWRATLSGVSREAPEWLARLVLAADQFAVSRPLRDDPKARSTIAGYPWFGDWGRDTMIALPGLLLATGNAGAALQTLETFAGFADGGMLPNFFPDAGERPEYNTADASLWFIEAVRQAFETTADRGFLQRMWATLASIVAAYRAGTRFGIGEDRSDGLISAGEPGFALTWMDAKVDGAAVTPRSGKPVEINALWLNALSTMAAFATQLGNQSAAAEYAALAARTAGSFGRYWNAERGYLFDVLDGPEGDDGSLRPNALFAVSLPHSALPLVQQRAVVDVCARHLLTTMGVRSLAAGESGYRGSYGGSARERDGAYHQGTVWCWLMGPFAIALWRAYGDRERALAYLENVGREIDAYGLGTLPEIADGDPPHVARGAIAQAWTVGEILRAWTLLAAP